MALLLNCLLLACCDVLLPYFFPFSSCRISTHDTHLFYQQVHLSHNPLQYYIQRFFYPITSESHSATCNNICPQVVPWEHHSSNQKGNHDKLFCFHSTSYSVSLVSKWNGKDRKYTEYNLGYTIIRVKWYESSSPWISIPFLFLIRHHIHTPVTPSSRFISHSSNNNLQFHFKYLVQMINLTLILLHA